jgi:hypothetical protein
MCTPDLVCALGVCNPAGVTGTPCANDADCDVAYHCDAGECAVDVPAGSPCTLSAECQDGLVCLAGVCSTNGGTGDPCSTNANCGQGFLCQGGQCVQGVADGGACTVAGDCLSGYCGGGRCCSGGDCCATALDCPAAYTTAASCTDAASCSGERLEAVCSNSVCGSEVVQDDSACGAGQTRVCGDYLDVACTGALDQTVDTCPTVCVLDGQCKSGSRCVDNACTPVVCEITGTAGQNVRCTLAMARSAQAGPAPAAANLTLALPAGATFNGVFVCNPLPNNPATVCSNKPAGYCATTFPADAPICDAASGRCASCTVKAPNESVTLTSGHQVNTCAQLGGSCPADQHQMVIFSPSSGPVITQAYVGGTGTITGNPNFITLDFTIGTAGTHAVTLQPGADFDAATVSAAPLTLTVKHGPTPANPAHWIEAAP